MAKSPKIAIVDPEQFYKDFPKLTKSNHRPASPATDRYNCIAYVVGDTNNWISPKDYSDAKQGARPVIWPLPYDPNPVRRVSLGEVLKALAIYRFSKCESGDIENGVQKIALFVDGEEVTHAALQLRDRNGRWKSKMGDNVDIEHELLAVEGPLYGVFSMFLSRPLR